MLINEKPRMDWAIGDTCWYVGPLDLTVRKGIVTDVFTENDRLVLTTMDEINNVRLRDAITLFRTKNDADTALKNYLDMKKRTEELAVAKYCSQIKTIKNLVEFGYDNDIGRHTEDDDPYARTAFIRMAKELLDLDLDD
ncbi:MAG: hypothetical protein HDQ88_11075 [Clostridia bacterium]|nr:hypothetical protein [Clostridia bacterium]